MAVHRQKKDRNYVVIPNHIPQNTGLSGMEKVVLILALSLPDDWVFNIKGISHFLKEGPCAVQAALIGLEKKGYVTRRRNRVNGQLKEMIYDFYEHPGLNKAFPMQDPPALEMPAQDFSVQAEGDIQSTDQQNKNVQNKDDTNNLSNNLEWQIEDRIRNQIEYDILCERYDPRLLEDLVAVMVNVMMVKNVNVVVSKDITYPAEYVRKCLAKINPLHIEQILDSLENSRPVIRNMRGYLLVSLINAASTMEMGYQYGEY